MTILTVSQLNSATWITLWKTYVKIFKLKDFCKKYVSRAKNVCKLQNNMKLFFSLFLIDQQLVFACPTSRPGKYGQPLQFCGLYDLLKLYLYPSNKI